MDKALEVDMDESIQDVISLVNCTDDIIQLVISLVNEPIDTLNLLPYLLILIGTALDINMVLIEKKYGAQGQIFLGHSLEDGGEP
jgi:hypothetical protein